MTSHANIHERYETTRPDSRDAVLRQTQDSASSSDGTSRLPFTLSLREGDPGQFHLVVNAGSRRVADASPTLPPQRGSPDISELKRSLGMPYDPQSIGPNSNLSYASAQGSPPISPIKEGRYTGHLDHVPGKPSIRSRIFGRLRKDGRSNAIGRRSTQIDISPQSSTREQHKHDSPQIATIDPTHTIPELDSRATVAELDATESEATQLLPAYSRYSQAVLSPGQATIAARSSYFPYDNGRTHSLWTPIATEETSFSDAETLVHDVQRRTDPDEDDTESSVLPFSTDVSSASSRRNSTSSIVPTPEANFEFSNAVWSPSSTSKIDDLHALLGPILGSIKATKPSPPYSIRTKSLQSKKHLSALQLPAHRRAKSFTFQKATNPSEVIQDLNSAPFLPRRSSRGPDLRVDTRVSVREPFHVDRDGDVYPDSASASRKRGEGRRRSNIQGSKVRSGASRVLQEAARQTSSSLNASNTERTPVRIRKARSSSSPQTSPKQSPPTIKIEPAPSVSIQSVRNIDPAKLSPDSSPVRVIPVPPDFAIAHSKRPTTTFSSLVATSLFDQALKAVSWLQKTYGPETPVEQGKVRVRWTCKCGAPLYDDFIERRPGAARALEAFLNSAGSRATSHGPSTPLSATSSMSSLHSNVFSQGNGSPNGFGSHSSLGSAHHFSWSPTRLTHNNPYSVVVHGANPQPSWLLTCANEGKFTTKLVHLDMSRSHIKSDKDLALTLRAHYSDLNRRWFRLFKLRGLVSINFVQLEVHRNRFADIRKSPDMPSGQAKEVYEFEPHELIPPVGEKYLLHLFKHPEDYDGELITYLRAPKRRERLDVGVGWGINMVEGFLADRVWTLVVGLFSLGSLIFAVVWVKVRQDDVQGAFGVAAWMTTLAVLGVGWAQACLD